MSTYQLYRDTRILLVDDDATLRSQFEKMLLELEFDQSCIQQASDGKKAMAIVEEKSTEFEFFIVDIVMPNMNGVEFVTALRKMPQYAQTPVMVLSSERDRTIIMSVINAGANNYMVKGAPLENFASQIVKTFEAASKKKAKA